MEADILGGHFMHKGEKAESFEGAGSVLMAYECLMGREEQLPCGLDFKVIAIC